MERFEASFDSDEARLAAVEMLDLRLWLLTWIATIDAVLKTGALTMFSGTPASFAVLRISSSLSPLSNVSNTSSTPISSKHGPCPRRALVGLCADRSRAARIRNDFDGRTSACGSRNRYSNIKSRSNPAAAKHRAGVRVVPDRVRREAQVSRWFHDRCCNSCSVRPCRPFRR